MPVTNKPWRVTHPDGVPWALKFYSEQAAWGRLFALVKMDDTVANRARLLRKGWKINRTEVTSEGVS